MDNSEDFQVTFSNLVGEIVQALQQTETRTSELLFELNKRGYSDFQIKEAVARLLQDHRIELTPRRFLRPVPRAIESRR